MARWLFLTTWYRSTVAVHMMATMTNIATGLLFFSKYINGTAMTNNWKSNASWWVCVKHWKTINTDLNQNTMKSFAIELQPKPMGLFLLCFYIQVDYVSTAGNATSVCGKDQYFVWWSRSTLDRSSCPVRKWQIQTIRPLDLASTLNQMFNDVNNVVFVIFLEKIYYQINHKYTN